MGNNKQIIKLRGEKCGILLCKNNLNYGHVVIKCRNCKCLVDIKPYGVFSQIGQTQAARRETRGFLYKATRTARNVNISKPCGYQGKSSANTGKQKKTLRTRHRL